MEWPAILFYYYFCFIAVPVNNYGQENFDDEIFSVSIFVVFFSSFD